MSKASLVSPLALTEQQIEYVISGYAAFREAEEILPEFCACFPEAVDAFQSEEDWEGRLKVAIERLYPGHPRFPKKHNLLFQAMRRTYLANVEDCMVSSAHARLVIMEETLAELESHAKAHPETFLECKKMQLDILKSAKDESYAFAKVHSGKKRLSPEEIQAVMQKLPKPELAIFRERHMNGESPDLILSEMIIAAESEDGTETESLAALTGESVHAIPSESESE